MKGIVLTLVLALAGCTFMAQRERSVEERAWDYACTLSGANCLDIEAPKVVVTRKLFGLSWDLMTALGFFLPGENNVYIKPMPQDADQFMVVLVHEMVHYLTDKTGQYPEVCDNEANAFRVGDKVAKRLGREDLVRGKDWWKPYGHCQNYGGTDGNT